MKIIVNNKLIIKVKFMKIILKILFILLIPFTVLFANYEKEAKSIEEIFTQVIELYKNGKDTEARELTQTAYFGHFENLEGGIRINLGQKKAYSMEKQFGDIRKAIKAGQDVAKIEAMIANLNTEIKEVLPTISSGVKLQAQKSDDGGLAAARMSSSVLESNPWGSVYENIKSSLDDAILAYDKKDGEALKNAMNKAKFNYYRNMELEIAVRRYATQRLDQMIQQIMGNVISENVNMQKNAFEQSIKDIDELISSAINKLPEESYVLAPKIEVEEKKVVDFTPTVQNIKDKMQNVLSLYKSGSIKEAISEAGDIYFDEYEASGMESKIGAIDITLKTATEASFSKIVSLMKSGVSSDKVSAEQYNLFSLLETSLEKSSTDLSGWALFIYALSIILREGFEALIIISAVVAYLIKTGNSKHLNIVYSSMIVAILLSFATAWAVNLIFGSNMAAQSREIIEGVVMLIAVGLLFYVGFWLLSNAGAKKWNHYIQGHITSSLTSGDSKALWWTLFLAVYREGAETVLFYQALIFDARSNGALGMVGLGFVAGIVILFILYFIIKAFSLKIAIKPFFIATSAIIFYMSIVFVGKGVMELVEGKLFVPNVIESIPTITWLGIYPYYESLIPQFLMILALIIGVYIIKQKQINLNKGEQV